MNTTPRLLFRVDANSKIGWGHFYRCLALAQMLKDKFLISFAMAAPTPDTIKQLDKNSFDYILLPEQNYTTPDERGDKELDFDLNELIKGFDVVVLDGYWFGEKYQQALRRYPAKVVIIEDDGYGEFYADLIINHAPGLDKNDYQSDVSNPLLALGPQYALLRPCFLKAAREDYSNKTSITKLLISFGGSDNPNLTGKALNWFLNNTDLFIYVILGAGYSHLDKLSKIISSAPDRVEVRRSLPEDQMLATMKAADAAILPASGVLFESIASRLPAITGTYSKNQEHILKGFLQHDVVIDADDFNDLSEAWNQLKTMNLTDLQKKQAGLIDGFSASRISELFQCLV